MKIYVRAAMVPALLTRFPRSARAFAYIMEEARCRAELWQARAAETFKRAGTLCYNACLLGMIVFSFLLVMDSQV